MPSHGCIESVVRLTATGACSSILIQPLTAQCTPALDSYVYRDAAPRSSTPRSLGAKTGRQATLICRYGTRFAHILSPAASLVLVTYLRIDAQLGLRVHSNACRVLEFRVAGRNSGFPPVR